MMLTQAVSTGSNQSTPFILQ